MRHRLLTVAASGLIVLSIAGMGWYSRDRPAVLTLLCRSGLPNWSVPEGLSEDDFPDRCTILGRRERYTGTYITAFELSSFQDGGELGTWLSFVPGASGTEKLNSPDVQRLGEDRSAVNLASITVEGWMTETAGHYGHMGMADRELFVGRVVSVGPPPANVTARFRQLTEDN